ncbi:MAG: acyl-CoA reductase [Chitinophagaceae bacterium]|nr:acyl-CoA reductase [Chitinophagaceae bacterium]
MMNLQQRIHILAELGNYMKGATDEWLFVRQRAAESNNWFIPGFIDLAINNITEQYLDKNKLTEWLNGYLVSDLPAVQKKVGIVMAGNIPLVGFHDFLCVFVSGHSQLIKPSSSDSVLITHLAEKMAEWYPETRSYISFAEQLKNCDAYIATGSNNSARYFNYYFGKYPHIIRRNRTSVAILQGNESSGELNNLADDIQQYFGLGCRNVTKIYVPEGYDFVPLLEALRRYSYFMDGHKYKHNYDYHLAAQIINNRYYMTNGSIVLVEDPSPYSPISQLHYEFYRGRESVINSLKTEEIQCIAGSGYVPFGKTQCPGLSEYADGADTLKFLVSL